MNSVGSNQEREGKVACRRVHRLHPDRPVSCAAKPSHGVNYRLDEWMSNSLDTKQKRARSAGANGPAGSKAAVAVARGMLPQLLGYELRLAQQAVFRDFEQSVGALGISAGRVGVLILVEANPGIAQSPLALAVGLDRSSLVPLLDQLEGAGWLERRAGTDRRSNGLWLTPAGATLLARVKARVRAHEKRIAARLQPAERSELMRLLRLLAGAP